MRLERPAGDMVDTALELREVTVISNMEMMTDVSRARSHIVQWCSVTSSLKQPPALVSKAVGSRASQGQTNRKSPCADQKTHSYISL